jgi:dihydroneopterin aldolase
MYVIRLKNCAFFARHGVFREEEALGQRFYVDAALFVDPGDSLDYDSIDGTVDYGAAFALIERIVTTTRYSLIEALALSLAKALTAEFPAVAQAEVTVRKPGAPIAGVLDHVEATVVWPQ